MSKFKFISGFFAIFFLTISCATMPTRDEQEKEMLLLLNKMAPLAQEIVDMNETTHKMMTKGMSKEPGDRDTFIQWRKENAIQYQRKTQNLITELQPYQYQYNSYKYRYIQNFGTIGYNEFIKKNDLYWGLGVYW